MQAHADPPDVGALLDAVEAGNVDRVRELLDGGDVGVNDADNMTQGTHTRGVLGVRCEDAICRGC
jgi:hypothetical protein